MCDTRQGPTILIRDGDGRKIDPRRGAGTGSEVHFRDRGWGRGAGYIIEIGDGDGDGVSIPGGDVPVAILSRAHC